MSDTKKTTIRARLQDEHLVIIGAPAISTGDVGAIDFDVESVSEEWEGYTLTAVFNDVEMALTDNVCTVPWEAIANGKTSMTIGVYGYSGSDTKTSTTVVYRLRTGTRTDNTPEPTPSVYQQWIAEIKGYYDGSKENADQTAADLQEVSELKEEALSQVQQATDELKQAQKDIDEAVSAAEQSAQAAAISEENAAESEDAAELSEKKAAQALADLLAMLGTDIATLVDGKIPVSQIPAIAITETYVVSSIEERDDLIVQEGDVCIVNIEGEQADESASYIYDGEQWKLLKSPTDYASEAGYAATAGQAENANTINNHRLINMTAEQYETAVKDENTFYLVDSE